MFTSGIIVDACSLNLTFHLCLVSVNSTVPIDVGYGQLAKSFQCAKLIFITWLEWRRVSSQGALGAYPTWRWLGGTGNILCKLWVYFPRRSASYVDCRAPFEAGQLKLFFNEWTKITSDPYILPCVSSCPLEFYSDPLFATGCYAWK